MTPETFKSLLTGYRLGTLSPEEQQELQALLHDPAYREQLENLFTEDLSAPEFPVTAGKEALDMVFEQVKLETAEAKIISFRPMRWAAAAVAVLAIGIGGYYLSSMPKSPQGDLMSSAGNKGENILPGGNKAVLTLSDGSRIALDDMANGEIAKESGVKITKTADGRVFFGQKVARNVLMGGGLGLLGLGLLLLAAGQLRRVGVALVADADLGQ